ncbi:cupin domain-containing protein [Solwaraspora sp. WMMD791]|uniref:cupin domain-containing protein n=1 Tax=Solwaraspora sp. WMMD791 TaxID=3016086 RepID=UPI00249BEE19|nr:cupin domain-containing protein [Solwaraspora sp. WMMD791]WFE29216.1 cupin domain-containing protein [Solwaraspora sp. WMMD791]
MSAVERPASPPSPPVVPRPVGTADVAANRRRGGDLRVLLGPSTVGATAGFLGVVTLAPGEYVSEHYHPYSEEFLYVVSGSVIVRLDGTEVPVDAGQAVFVPIGVPHRVTNSSDAPAVATFQLCPLAPRPELGHVDTEPQPGAGPTLQVGPGLPVGPR